MYIYARVCVCVCVYACMNRISDVINGVSIKPMSL